MKKIALGHVLVAVACLALVLGIGIGVGVSIRAADAARNSAGTMASFNGPYVANQVIAASLFNNRFGDIETEITASLDRSGRGGMLAALRGIDGTLAAPAFSWTSETGSGLFRNGAGDVRMSVLGALRENWTSTGVAVTGTFSATGAATLSSTLGVTGTTSLATGGTKLVVDGTTIASNAALYAGTVTPGAANYILASDGFATTTAVNAPTGGKVELNINGVNIAKVNGSGLTIGASGTAISASYRGTTSWTPGSLSGACATTTISLTGAASGADCTVTPPSALGSANILSCTVTANTCNLNVCVPGALTMTPPAGTYACRVDNP